LLKIVVVTFFAFGFGSTSTTLMTFLTVRFGILAFPDLDDFATGAAALVPTFLLPLDEFLAEVDVDDTALLDALELHFLEEATLLAFETGLVLSGIAPKLAAEGVLLRFFSLLGKFWNSLLNILSSDIL
jgi:hypothetical protein